MTTTRFARRVLLVEDEGILRALLKTSLEAAGYDVEACATAAEALLLARSFDPDALVTDIDLGAGGNGLELATSLVERQPTLAVVVLSTYGMVTEQRHPALKRAQYLNKTTLEDPSTLVAALDSTVRNEHRGSAIDPKVTENPAAAQRIAQLTRSQVQILRMIASGLTNAQIAERRGVSMTSVEHIIRRMWKALQLPEDSSMNRRVAAARIYYEGLGTPSESVMPSAGDPPPPHDLTPRERGSAR